MTLPLRNGKVKAGLVGILFFATTALYFASLPKWIEIIVVGVAAVLYALLAYAEAESPVRLGPSDLLKLMIESVYQTDSHKVRAAVYVWDKKKQRIKVRHSHGMTGSRDLHHQFRRGEWCVGRAYDGRVPVTFDGRTESLDKWKLSGKLWPDMASAIAIPIYPRDSDLPRGILRIDTSMTLEEAGFSDAKMVDILGAYAELLGPMTS